MGKHFFKDITLYHIFFINHILWIREELFLIKKSGRSLFKSIQGRLGYGPIVRLTKNILFEEAARFKPDILWIDGGFLVDNETVNSLKKQGITLIHYTQIQFLLQVCQICVLEKLSNLMIIW